MCMFIQVANYCSERMHLALAEEMEMESGEGSNKQQDQWKKAFRNCFVKVDGEISSKGVASETVGSTAVVAIVLPTHIVVSNCGDSRVVLCRGKLPMALSIDHKVSGVTDSSFIYYHFGHVNRWSVFCSLIERMNMQG